MKIDIWSDIVCPFCTIGKRHLELALENFEHRDDVDITFHSFELDPSIEAEPTMNLVDKIAHKYGISTEQSEASQQDIANRAAQVGLTFNYRDAKFGNTFDAHRLTHLAVKHDLGLEAQQRLMLAYFTEGRNIARHDELQRIGEEIGLPADEVQDLLAGDAYAQEVRADEAAAGQLGISGVPFFIFDNKYAVSGAQPVELFEQALKQTWDEREPKLVSLNSDADAPACEGDNCAI